MTSLRITATGALFVAALALPTVRTSAHLDPLPGIVLPHRPHDGSFNVVSQIGGATLAFALESGLAYVGVGPRLFVLEIGDGTELNVVGQSDIFPGVVQGVAVAGSYAYVAAGSKGGLLVVDLVETASPRLVATLDTPGEATDVAVVNGAVYLADGRGGHLRAYDVSEPAAPVELMEIESPQEIDGQPVYQGYARALHTDGRHLFVVEALSQTEYGYYSDGVRRSRGYLQIYDITDPRSPRHVGRWGPSLATAVLDVATDEDVAFVSVDYEGLDPAGAVVTLDLSAPGTPVVLGSFSASTGIEKLAASDHKLYYLSVHDSGKNYDRYQLHVLDAADPVHLEDVAAVDLYGDPEALLVCDDMAYSASGIGGLQAIDVSDPRRPLPGQRLDTLAYAKSLVLVDDHAYVANRDGVYTVDVRDPQHPAVADHEPSSGYGMAPAASDGRLYFSARPAPIGIYDLSNPDHPLEVARIEEPSSSSSDDPRNLAVLGNLLLVTGSAPWQHPSAAANLTSIDVDDPIRPQQLGRMDFPDCEAPPLEDPGVSLEIAIVQQSALVTLGQCGVRAVDVGDPADLELAGTLAVTQFSTAYDVAARGDLAYVTVDDELWTVDISNPGQLAVVAKGPAIQDSRRSDSQNGRRVALSDNVAFVSAADDGLNALVLSDAGVPGFPLRYDTPGAAMSAATDENRVYVADNAGGLLILEYAGENGPEATVAPQPTAVEPSSIAYFPALIHAHSLP